MKMFRQRDRSKTSEDPLLPVDFDEKSRSCGSISLLAFLLFLGLILYGNSIAIELPRRILTLGIVLTPLGVPISIYGYATMNRYKDVFDYEPTQFWGRASNGGTVRGILNAIAMIGLWCSLSGITLLIIVWLRLTHRL